MIWQIVWELTKKYFKPFTKDAKDIVILVCAILIASFLYTCGTNYLHNKLKYEFCYKKYNIFLCDHTEIYYKIFMKWYYKKND